MTETREETVNERRHREHVESHREKWAKLTEETGIEYGYCLCSCGQETDKANRTDRGKNWVRGEHKFYLQGHSRKKKEPESVPAPEMKKGPFKGICMELGCTTKLNSYNIAANFITCSRHAHLDPNLPEESSPARNRREHDKVETPKLAEVMALKERSVRGVSSEAKCSVHTIRHAKNGREIKRSTAERIAEALGVTLEELTV